MDKDNFHLIQVSSRLNRIEVRMLNLTICIKMKRLIEVEIKPTLTWKPGLFRRAVPI